ncbi:glycosyltransferase family 1 protein [Glonium stellatum]|uniref:UDP-N-acetylglucosamine transferase subunit ALG14 n=1 Tax=Glonium stellatum TaxID=574774 RepID=A0A8E2JLC6_9PEZI|nr:glycosyltransferase family 1 protein [Glonium stellatum]
MTPHTPLALITSYSFVLAVALVGILAITLRLLALFPSRRLPPPKRRIGTPTRLLIVLGSGGHTAEMLGALHGLDPRKYTHRTYVISSGDVFSTEKAAEFERSLELKDATKRLDQLIDMNEQMQERTGTGSYDIAIVPRARRIHQSLLSTPLSALRCLWACFNILMAPSNTTTVSLAGRWRAELYDYPDLIVTNGPATAVIVILASLILRFFDIKGANSRGKMRTIYVESWARVKRLSLSGRLLVRIVDRFLVQWERLQGVGERGEYLGVFAR